MIRMRATLKKAARPVYLLLALAMFLGIPIGAWQMLAASAPPQVPHAVATPPAATAPAPDFTLEYPNGTRITLSSLAGKPVLLNFWAST